LKLADHFNKQFIRRERRAILFILFLVIIIHLAGKLARPGFSFDHEYMSLDSIKMVMNRSESALNSRYDELRIEHPFDPDTVSSQTLVAWGFSQDIALRWIKYRQLVNGFHSGSQIKSIYGIDSVFYDKLLPFMEFKTNGTPEPTETSSIIMTGNKETLTGNTPNEFSQIKSTIRKDHSAKKTVNAKQNILIDINNASIDDWQKLYGIGPYYAKRITEFRDKLGGFYSIDQVGETYYLPDSVYLKIRPFLVYKSPQQRIDVNKADYNQLAGHPYISPKQANSILNYRKQHGPYKHTSDLRKIISLDTDFINKVSPYLNISIDTIK